MVVKFRKALGLHVIVVSKSTSKKDEALNLLKDDDKFVRRTDKQQLEVCYDRSKTLSGSVTGGTKDTREMLKFCAANKIYPGIEMIPIDYINEALERMVKKDVKYRFVIDIKKNSLKLMFSQGNKKRVPLAVAFNPMMNHFSDYEEDWFRNSCFDSFTYEDSDFVDVTSIGEGENVEIHENSDRDSDGCETSRVFEADKATFYSMRFKMTEEAFAIFNQYAKLVGFSVLKDTSIMRTNGVRVKRRFLCSVAGEKNDFIGEHTHPLVPDPSSMFLRSHRNVSEEDLQFAMSLVDVGVRKCKRKRSFRLAQFLVPFFESITEQVISEDFLAVHSEIVRVGEAGSDADVSEDMHCDESASGVQEGSNDMSNESDLFLAPTYESEDSVDDI
ncbi:hypothetical protein IFM89_024161 [Coptis chinensis]|uniref:Protein FAR1-RELATED SEQUENCE n=1 Tax=Coptis chinensis TaxID=261450 RepID=A0A835M6F7_9MAGN|nr:hypothetical protein IFM89_024161 [Coptis chinensis]